MKFISSLLFVLSVSFSFAQTWSSEVAEIFYNKCTKCHHPGGGGPFSLVEYSEASSMATSIYDAVYQGNMPPWPPSDNSAEFLHDRSLEANEKTTILNWLTAGFPEGDASQTPPPPVYNVGSILGNGDLEVQIPTYASKAISEDDYVCFSLPTNLTENRIIKAVEVIPGNPEIVHHVLVYVDQNGSEVTDTIGGDCASPSDLSTKLVGGFTPGATPIIFPSQDPIKLGVSVNAGAKIYLNMHYPIGSYGLVDSTRVIFHFYPQGESDVREVSSDPLLINYTFMLAPEQVTSVDAQYPNSGTTSLNYSLFSIFPHMHLLGKEIGAFAVKPGQDTVRLIDIPHWDFDWQDFYKFRYLQKIPQGSKIHGYGTFDNTSSNIHNPFSPPQTIFFGLNTTDEMFITYFQYLPYVTGDENYDLTDLTALSLEEYLPENSSGINVYPNPFGIDGIRISFMEPLKPNDQVYIYDNLGNRVAIVPHNNEKELTWKGTNENGQVVKSGVYYVSVNIEGVHSHQKIIKIK
jgi:hypothetical protein